MEIIKFLGLLALGMFLILVIISIKNVMDAEITKMIIQTKVRKAITKSVYLVMKSNEELKKTLHDAGADDEEVEDMLEYLRGLSRDEIKKECEFVYGESFDCDLDALIDDEEYREK